MTNEDKIRQMTDEELLDWLDGLHLDYDILCMCDYDPARCKNYVGCRECWKDWLAEEADENREKKDDKRMSKSETLK